LNRFRKGNARKTQQAKGGRGERPFLPFAVAFALVLLFLPSPFLPRAWSYEEAFSPVIARPNPARLAGKGDEWEFGTRSGAFLGNRMMPLKQFFGDWEGDVRIEDKNRVHSRASVEMLAARSGWELSVGVREELSLSGNRDGVEIIRLLKGKKDLPTGRKFQVSVGGDGFLVEELRLSRGMRVESVPGLSAGAGLGLLRGERIQRGEVGGLLTVTGRRAYDYALDLDYNYDINYLYDLSASRKDRSGYGYSLDAGVSYRRGGWTASLKGEDLLSAIRWNGVPTTVAVANNGRRYFDGSGYVHYDPLITGFEGTTSFTQRLKGKWSAEAAWERDFVRLSAGAARMWNDWFPNARVAFRIPDRTGWLSLGFDAGFRMAGLEYEGKRWGVSLYANRPDPETTRSAGFRVRLGY
jgi:hypothetical protein